ncbi:hypothetical protein AJ88_17145 [Mesorhizobium amorphae CCBAU 01583]|nr:hypothetical protein AJ88_17145 [Mesorhizobium amorphae CCBAU 01583]
MRLTQPSLEETAHVFLLDGESVVTPGRMTVASTCLPQALSPRCLPAASPAGSPLRSNPSMTSTFAILLPRSFRNTSRLRHAALLSLPHRVNHAFDGGDDEILFTHFAPPRRTVGLIRAHSGFPTS